MCVLLCIVRGILVTIVTHMATALYGILIYITRYFVYLLPTVLETIPTLPRAAARLAHASRPHRTDIAAGLLGRAPHRFVSFGQLTPPRRSVAFRTRCT